MTLGKIIAFKRKTFNLYCSDDEAVRLIKSGGPIHKKNDNWKESNTGGIHIKK